MFAFGLAAVRPSAPDFTNRVGNFYYATDTGVLSAYIDTGTGTRTWVNIGSGSGGSPLQLPVMTVSGGSNNLPAAAAGNKGQMAYVTDLNVITIGATAAHGATGAGIVVSNGTNWIVGGLPAQS